MTQEGDTLDCRQWQRVLAVPGKLMLRSDDYYNVTKSAICIRLSLTMACWSMTHGASPG
ncbi:protein YedD [Enterobacter cancerogenus]|uniref:Protein YedD n=1 Tax=Enterobacter cancerogenus TaxID=69218 RepID=A0A484Y3R2_9ENTR|nr:protein YedD [Enterobacter cancerogenus]